MIVFDIDDTLVDYKTPFVHFMESVHNKIPDFSIDGKFCEVFGCDQWEMDDYIKEFSGSVQCKRLEPFKGAVEFVNKLSHRHEIIFLTAYNKQFKDIRFECLKDFKYDGIIFSDNKAEWIEKLKPDYIFEDNPFHIQSFPDDIPVYSRWNEYVAGFNIEKLNMFNEYTDLETGNFIGEPNER